MMGEIFETFLDYFSMNFFCTIMARQISKAAYLSLAAVRYQWLNPL